VFAVDPAEHVSLAKQVRNVRKHARPPNSSVG
jgi:hypothetical protein